MTIAAFLAGSTQGDILQDRYIVLDDGGLTDHQPVSMMVAGCRTDRTQVNVVWEPIAEKIDENSTRYTNRVTAHPTDAFMAFLEEHGTRFEDAAARQAAGGDHNSRETPLFAASIGRRALSR